MLIDATTDIGKIRLRVGDYQDITLFPDAVYNSALSETKGNLPRASVLMARYILGLLTAQTHQKLASIEVYGSDYFKQYLEFIKMTILNPNMMELSPLPYSSTGITVHPLQQFVTDWNLNFAYGTQNDMLHIQALGGFSNGAGFF